MTNWYRMNAEDEGIVHQATPKNYLEYPDLPTNGKIYVLETSELDTKIGSGGVKIILPPKNIYVLGTIDLTNKPSPWSIQGQGINRTKLRKLGDLNEPLIKMSGFYNSISDLHLEGTPTPFGEPNQELKPHQGAWCGIYVQGKILATTKVIDTPVKFNTFRNIVVRKFRIGIRIGHESKISDVNISTEIVGIFPPGAKVAATKDLINDTQKDGSSSDIASNHWQNIQLEDNYYGIVKDGQTNLNDHHENMKFTNIERAHVYLPQGGDFHCFTAQFAGTTRSDPFPFPKIYSAHGGSILLVNARSENNTDIIPEFLVADQTFVELNNVRVEYNDEKAIYSSMEPGPLEDTTAPVFCSEKTYENVMEHRWTCRDDIRMRLGKLTLINCNIAAGISFPYKTNYVFTNSEVGALYHGGSKGVILPQHIIT